MHLTLKTEEDILTIGFSDLDGQWQAVINLTDGNLIGLYRNISNTSEEWQLTDIADLYTDTYFELYQLLQQIKNYVAESKSK